MSLKKNRSHAIEAIFPLVLFFVFTLSALVLVLLAVNIYRDTTESALFNSSSGTAMSYLSEKLHRSDSEGAVSVESFAGSQAIVLKESAECSNYRSYIYAYDGALRELFVKEGGMALPEAGRVIMPVQSFTVTEHIPGLLIISCTDESGSSSEIAVTLMAK